MSSVILTPLHTLISSDAAVRFGFALQLPSPQDSILLTNYSWPDNVRELAAVIDRAAILGAGKSLEIAKSLGGMAHGRLTPQTIGTCPSVQCCGSGTEDIGADNLSTAMSVFDG
jgi:DNA-binding NtrC family response regulator